MTRYLCPVCRREIAPTLKGNVQQHFDSIRNTICPAGGEPYRIMIERNPEFSGVAA